MARLHAGQFMDASSDDTGIYSEPRLIRSSERGATLRAEFARAVERRLAATADDGGAGLPGGGPGGRLINGLPHRLAHRDSCANSDAGAGRTTRRTGRWDRLPHLELPVAAQVAA